MNWSSLFLLAFLAALIYIYRKKLIDYNHLVDGLAEIEFIKLEYMSSIGIDLSLNRTIMNNFHSTNNSSSTNKTIEVSSTTSTLPEQKEMQAKNNLAVPEVLVKYIYHYKDVLYKGEAYLSPMFFLGDLPFYLDFDELGNDFPVLQVPQGNIVGEEAIENFLLSLRSNLEIQIDSENPRLAFVVEEET